MNKLVVLKIAAIIIIPFLIMLAGIFFLYPKINADKYDQIVSEFEQQQEEQLQSMASDLPQMNYEIPAVTPRNTAVTNNAPQNNVSTPDPSYLQQADSMVQNDSLYIKMLAKADENIHRLEENELRLHGVIDSLYAELDRMEMKIDSLENFENREVTVDPEEFAGRIKSLLNLEDDELSPILRNLNNDQIVKLYFAGGTIQRQKILRALEAKKAAEIMTEIM